MGVAGSGARTGRSRARSRRPVPDAARTWAGCRPRRGSTTRRSAVARVFVLRVRFARVVPMSGKDTYLHGYGRMLGKLAGLITVADGKGVGVRHRRSPLPISTTPSSWPRASCCKTRCVGTRWTSQCLRCHSGRCWTQRHRRGLHQRSGSAGRLRQHRPIRRPAGGPTAMRVANPGLRMGRRQRPTRAWAVQVRVEPARGGVLLPRGPV